MEYQYLKTYTTLYIVLSIENGNIVNMALKHERMLLY